MSIAVSIVSFNTKDLLNNCLKNLTSQKTEEKVNIWVLDNDSDDGSAQMVQQNFPDVNLIKGAKNFGFAKGQNQILEKIKDEYVLLLNPDTEFEKNAIDAAVSFMEKNPDCIVASCKLTDFDGNLESNGGDFPFGRALFTWLFNLEFLGKFQNFHRSDSEYYEKTHEVDWVGGTFMIIRTEIFKTIGFLNEDFFMYFEDVEFCYRVKKSGGKIMIYPEISVKHKSGSSSKNPRFIQWKGEFEGLIKFYNKQTGFIGAVYVRVLIYLAIILRIAVFFVTGAFNKSAIYTKVMLNI